MDSKTIFLNEKVFKNSVDLTLGLFVTDKDSLDCNDIKLAVYRKVRESVTDYYNELLEIQKTNAGEIDEDSVLQSIAEMIYDAIGLTVRVIDLDSIIYDLQHADVIAVWLTRKKIDVEIANAGTTSLEGTSTVKNTVHTQSKEQIESIKENFEKPNLMALLQALNQIND